MDAKNKEEILLLKVKTLTEKPGVYRFFDEGGKILYVGKAKNLKRRVSSYFAKKHDYGKLRLMVSKIRDLQTTVVENEWEALLLENSMIKEYQPRFNALLKDDKSYPWIAVTQEDFPRIFLTRQPDRKSQELFGPYASVHTAHLLLETLFEAFKIRTCKTTERHGRPCLQYQIKRCPGICAGYISKEEYQGYIRQAVDIIKGRSGAVIKQMKEEMMAYAGAWEFEKAQEMKEKIALLEHFRGKSTVVNPEIDRVDVFSILMDDGESCCINFIRVVEGSVIQSYTFDIAHRMESQAEDLLLLGMAEIERKFGKLSREAIVPFIPDIQSDEIHFTVPRRGDKKKLLDLSLKNAQIHLMEKKKRQELVNPERHAERTLQALQKALNMDQYPNHIECFDNSNTQGSEPVAAMVCFLNGKPAKQEYRHFNIKTVEGSDDFASMEEVVFRRYKRLRDEEKPLPQLVVIDGGKGQLGAAHRALSQLGLSDKILLIGIAKRLEDIYKVGDPLPLYLDKKSEAQKLLQRIRDEVHRFGITHHRKRRGKKSLASQLDGIPGIGKKLSEKLLSRFKSVKRIREANEEELSQVIGSAKAKIVREYLLQQPLS